MKSRIAMIASILFFNILMSCSYGSKQTSGSKGIIGADDSSLVSDKPAFGEYLTKDIEGKIAAGCNGVRVAGGEIYTANHCLSGFKLKDTVILSGKAAATRFESHPNLDLATGFIVGGGAPSNSIAIFEGKLGETIELESVWFDAKIGRWRLSKGLGHVKGAFIEHELDMIPGASGSGLYTIDSTGKKFLVAIHLGYIKERNVNLAVSVVGDFRNSKQSLAHYRYQPEEPCCCYYKDGSDAPWEKCFKPSDDGGDDDGGNGGNGGNGSGGNGNGSGEGSSDDPGDTDSGPNDDGPTDDESTEGTSSQGGPSGPAPGTGTGPGRGSVDAGFPIFPGPSGSGPGYAGTGPSRGNTRPCFECDLIRKELENQTEFNKDNCEPSEIEPLFKDVNISEGVTPQLTFNSKTPSEFTESLRNFAERLLRTVKWKPDDEVKSLPEDVQKKIQDWLNQVVKNLDDYYALIISSLKSESLKAPELKDIDVSPESIEQARAYLNAVESQVLNNPDQYLNARKEVIRSADAAFGVAEEALKNGDHETASAAIQIGIAFADVAIGATPVVGWVKDAIEAGTGYSLLTGEKLDDFSRASAWVGVFSAGIGSKLLAVGKVAVLAVVVTKVSKGGQAVGEADRIFLKAQDLYRAAREAGITTDTKDRIDRLVEGIKFRNPMATVQEIEKDVARSIDRYKNLPLVKGERPTNGLYAGETYLFSDLKPALKEKYPNGVKFSEDGFPDFSPYAKELKGGQRSVVIEPTSSHKSDVDAANALAGELDGTPLNWTWHHHQDRGVMQLIPRDLHRAISHNGGASIWGYNSKL
ncbi:MAG TPA: HNH endonuclease [Oligoflexus sp.]|uniref:HNH endonuclease n=1 Tax=Oligoflexus sp. TaxID=1971216 RepID=UPI002D5C4955|nr:HNH endonuclease [Oligoflexus sp.]HYX38224.1 HNH endonuclease [Oligoflexus sp.]